MCMRGMNVGFIHVNDRTIFFPIFFTDLRKFLLSTCMSCYSMRIFLLFLAFAIKIQYFDHFSQSFPGPRIMICFIKLSANLI